eukprot:5975621-Pyramimonas_sp.AAC.1
MSVHGHSHLREEVGAVAPAHRRALSWARGSPIHISSVRVSIVIYTHCVSKGDVNTNADPTPRLRPMAPMLTTRENRRAGGNSSLRDGDLARPPLFCLRTHEPLQPSTASSSHS